MCGGVAKWLKCLTTEQKVPGSSTTVHVCMCMYVGMIKHRTFKMPKFMWFVPVKRTIQTLVTITDQN